jgi:hypothetical protein
VRGLAIDAVALAAGVGIARLGLRLPFLCALALAEARDSFENLSARRRYPPWPPRRIRSGRPTYEVPICSASR